ncbi:MAG TPA: hypothetical protein VMU44_13555 [Steroidobacteraceae bacterium]|nr:hypothetical protein [Steroidobacteraceae bacterium]
MVRFPAWILLAALAYTATVSAQPGIAGTPAAPAVEPPMTAVAHSAGLSVEGGVAGGVLTLRVRRTSDPQPLKVTDLAVRLDGRTLPVMARTDGSYAAPLKDVPPHAPGKLEIIVAHDGTLEALDGQLPAGPPAAGAGSGGGGGGTLGALIHKQMSWWILNVVIVLIGVIAVSRRMS